MQVLGVYDLLNERRRLLFGILVTGLLAGFGWLVLRPHEPVFQRKPLSVWLKEAYPNGVYDLSLPSSQAANAVSAMGADAVPQLLRMASARDSIQRRILINIAREFPFLHLPMCENEGELAVWAFKVLGPKGKPAVPGLVRLLQDKDPVVRFDAARSLGAVGTEAQEAVPALIDALRRASGSAWQDAALRDAAAGALGEMGPAALPAMSDLAALTNVPSAALALIKIKGDSILPFIDRLRDTSDVRQWVRTARVVAGLTTNAEPAVPILLSVLDSTNRTVVEQALYALVRIQRRPDLCIPAVIKLLDSDEPNVRYQSVILLGVFGAEAKPAVPEIIRMIDRSKQWQWVQREATNALKAIEPEAAARLQANHDDSGQPQMDTNRHR